jgi:energy-coupling factor transport system ATP-binding protein
MRRRLATLRTSAFLAVGFVVLRVVYRVVFGGGSNGGVVLVDVPRIPLSGPFAQISLFGPVTSGGLAGAALTAVPFAVAIVAVGLLGVVVDLRAWLVRGSMRGPLRSVSRSLVVAWSTFPALREAVARVRVARELRGERSLASLLVPVLEQTVERAIALAASMEVRGFAATRRPEPECERPVVIQDGALAFDGTPILERVTFDLAPGTLTLVTGATGSGKSTLLQAMSGVFQHHLQGEQSGTITVGGADRLSTPPRETAGFVGVVSQSVPLSFVAETVDDEIGFALAVRGVAPTIVASRVREVAARVEITHLLGRATGMLSAGEACLVAVGAALISHPLLLLVDEPLAELDAHARARVVGLLDRLAHEAGVCVVVAEHARADWAGIVDGWVELRDGSAVMHTVDDAGPWTQGAAAEAGSAAPLGDVESETVADIRRLSVRHGARLAVDDANVALGAQEIVALTGPNGAGKSSLLHAIARPAVAGVVSVRGVDTYALRRRRGRRRRAVALVPEAFDDLLFCPSVEAECRRADRRGREGTLSIFLGFLGVEPGSRAAVDLAGRHPRDLSAGQRLCLVLALQLSARPAVLLVDEPTRGLDASARALVGAALTRAAGEGATVLMATHDRAFAAQFARREIGMAGGRVEAVPAGVSR